MSRKWNHNRDIFPLKFVKSSGLFLVLSLFVYLNDIPYSKFNDFSLKFFIKFFYAKFYYFYHKSKFFYHQAGFLLSQHISSKNLLLKILDWIDQTFYAVVTANIRWWNVVPTLGVLFDHSSKWSNEWDLTILWLQLLQNQNLVQLSTKVLTVYWNPLNKAKFCLKSASARTFDK